MRQSLIRVVYIGKVSSANDDRFGVTNLWFTFAPLSVSAFDEKISEKLIPLFDRSGRLFVASDDPVPSNAELEMKRQELDLRYGVISINEVRQQRGLPPVSWGDKPWLPLQWAPTDFERRGEFDLPNIGRNRPSE